MTLQPYDPAKLDELVLRMLDVSQVLRKMSLQIQQHEPAGFALHDKKALEWLEALEHWSRRADAELEVVLIKNRGARRALRAVEKAGQVHVEAAG
jgi:hypothetical protein